MPYENLALQLKGDNWARTMERLQEELARSDVLPERQSLETQIARAREKVKTFEQHGIRPNPARTDYEYNLGGWHGKCRWVKLVSQ